MEDASGKEHFYRFVILVFGLGPAGQVLGRVMRPILRFLSNNGVRNTMYVDDGHVVNGSKKGTDADYSFTIKTFKSTGFIVAAENPML
jgi:hypothetical protein